MNKREWKVIHITKSKALPKAKASEKHYSIDDIAGIIASDVDDQQLLDEYLSEKYDDNFIKR